MITVALNIPRRLRQWLRHVAVEARETWSVLQDLAHEPLILPYDDLDRSDPSAGSGGTT